MIGNFRKSLSFKTTLLYVVLATIIISVFNFVIWENQSDLIIENQKLMIETASAKLRKYIQRHSGAAENSDRKSNFALVAEEALNEGVGQIVVFSEGGDILYSKVPNWSAEDTSSRELILINRSIARYELENKQFLHYTDLSRGTISLYLPVRSQDGLAMNVYKFVLPIEKLIQKKNELLRICLLVALFICILQIIMWLFLRKIIIFPISKLVRMTKEVARGDLEQRIALRQEDEIGILANAYNEMVQNLKRMQDEAKGANPLSGLPGNLAIMRNIDDRLKRNEDLAVIYGDLDNFKAYNDKYGLNKGDQAILHCRDVFLRAALENGGDRIFVGHEGGDDFVLVTPFEFWEPICRAVVAYFDKGVPRFYNAEHLRQGYIDAKDRQGNDVRFPLMSISLAVVSNHYRAAKDHRTLITWASEMKKAVKKIAGSAYAIDRRRD